MACETVKIRKKDGRVDGRGGSRGWFSRTQFTWPVRRKKIGKKDGRVAGFVELNLHGL